MTQLTRIGNLDFNDIKTSIKTYLKNQTEFSDYNFEGSGLTQLINVLAYNSHYDSLAANFLANEVFLDTATLRSSVVSRAKELGYVSRSRRAATTTLNISVSNLSNQSQLGNEPLPAGSTFSSKVDARTFTFTTLNPTSLTKQILSDGSIVYNGNTTVYEGMLVQNSFTYNSVNNIIAIPNTDIDTSTLSVSVLDNGQWLQFVLPQNFLTINSTSQVYMIQEGLKGFEIYFGDGVLGKKPANGTAIIITYIVTSGSVANGAATFSMTSSLQDEIPTTTKIITATLAAAGGQMEESIESIKLNTKSTFNVQNRAVTASDYAVIASQNFPSVSSVLSWDGADNIPPKFGQVVLCAIPSVGDVLSQSQKDVISTFLKKKSVGNTKVVFQDPAYVSVLVYSKIKYNANKLTTNEYILKTNIQSAITNYIKTSAMKFNGVFRYSPLLGVIDSTDYAIISNETIILLDVELKVNSFAKNNYVFSFANTIIPSTMYSTKFYDGVSGDKLYLKSTSNGTINIYHSVGGVETLYKTNVGTINYTTGYVTINNLSISYLDGKDFTIIATPESNDIYSSKNIILSTLQEDITIDLIQDNT